MAIRSIKNKAIAFILISFIIAFGLMYEAWIAGYRPWGKYLDFERTGQFADFISGVVGTIINAAAFYFLYLTLKEQRKATSDQNKAFEKERFESNFFELLKLHRDNVTELTYKKSLLNELNVYQGREVFKIIFEEFLECLQEVRRFSKSTNLDEYVTLRYKLKLQEIKKRINPQINLIELINIDIAYCIVFFGVSSEGEISLRNLFSKRYNSNYYYRLLKYIQLKPMKNAGQEVKWHKLQALDIKKRKVILDEIYQHRNHVEPFQISDLALLIIPDSDYTKYYEGHQFRLGHYFRHMFQSYKFLNDSILNDTEKYFYGKTYRAQLSTYEQALLFINSISILGMRWELIPDVDTMNKTKDEIAIEMERAALITKYNLTKNLPGEHLFGIRYKDYYPKVKYEMDNN